jgi:coenzyme PQQ precursor peptide PqqA
MSFPWLGAARSGESGLSTLLYGLTTERRRSPRTSRIATSNAVTGENTMWTKPEYTEMRFGFEVTMYIANR